MNISNQREKKKKATNPNEQRCHKWHGKLYWCICKLVLIYAWNSFSLVCVLKNDSISGLQLSCGLVFPGIGGAIWSCSCICGLWGGLTLGCRLCHVLHSGNERSVSWGDRVVSKPRASQWTQKRRWVIASIISTDEAQIKCCQWFCWCFGSSEEAKQLHTLCFSAHGRSKRGRM